MSDAMNPGQNKTTSHSRLETTQRLFRLFVMGALCGALICIILYLRTGVWQIVAVAISLLCALLVGGASQLLARLRQKKSAIITALLAVLVGYAAPLLFWENATGYFLIGGGLIILIMGSILLGKWKYRIGILFIFLLCTIIASEIPLFPRYPIQNSPALSVLLPLITLLICIGAIWQFIRTFPVNTIRTRLLISFITIAVLPLMIAAIAASSIGTQATINSAADMLTAVISFKETALRSWITSLQDNLHIENSRDEQFSPMVALIENPPGDVGYKIAYRNLANRFNNAITLRGDFHEMLILNQDGIVTLSTNPNHEGMDLRGERFFQSGIKTPTAIPPSYISLLNGNGVAVSEPILDGSGATIGVLAALTDLQPMNEIMLERQGVGQTGETYLVDENFSLLTPSINPDYSREQTQVISRGSMDAVLSKRNGSGVYDNYSGNTVVGVYRWLPDLNLAIMAEQTRDEIFAPTFATIAINSAISFAMIIGTIIFAVLITNSIARPLADLTNAARRIAAGELNFNAPIGTRNDEITILAISFNKMTEELRKLITNLEQRVSERTRELELRGEQLQAASNLGSTVTSILDLEELTQHVVNLIQDRFGLYYVGLFLVNENREYAVLKSWSGLAGHAMLSRDPKIKIGEGMVGLCIFHAEARVTLENDSNSIHGVTLDLPETKSEVAIPLRSRGQVLGALTIHSKQARAFDNVTITTFQSMADQIAVAIDNARLFTETQKALESTRQAYGELSREAWLNHLNTKPIRLLRNINGLSLVEADSPYDETERPNGAQNDRQSFLEIPIKVRNQVIGVIQAQKPMKSGAWNEEDQEMLATLTDQLGVALESARLFEETLMRAEHERLVGDISGRIRETLDIETVLKTAVIEMRNALDLDEVEVRMSKV